MAWQSGPGRYTGCPSDAEVDRWFRWIAASLRSSLNDRERARAKNREAEGLLVGVGDDTCQFPTQVMVTLP